MSLFAILTYLISFFFFCSVSVYYSDSFYVPFFVAFLFNFCFCFFFLSLFDILTESNAFPKYFHYVVPTTFTATYVNGIFLISTLKDTIPLIFLTSIQWAFDLCFFICGITFCVHQCSLIFVISLIISALYLMIYAFSPIFSFLLFNILPFCRPNLYYFLQLLAVSQSITLKILLHLMQEIQRVLDLLQRQDILGLKQAMLIKNAIVNCSRQLLIHILYKVYDKNSKPRSFYS